MGSLRRTLPLLPLGLTLLAFAAAAPRQALGPSTSEGRQSSATPTPQTSCLECDFTATRAAGEATALALFRSPTLASGESVVWAAVFWMRGCPHCEEVIRHVLPPLQETYASRLELVLVEVVTFEDVERLSEVAAFFGISKENAAVPLLVIGEQALVGSAQISAVLPELIERYLAQGGVDLPDIPALAAALPTTAPGTTPGGPVQTPGQPSGFTLAVVVLIAMAAALVYVLAALFARRLPLPAGGWTDVAILCLGVVGLGLAAYLSYVETRSVEAFCGPVGDCNTVQASRYARLLGFLPVGILGVAGYVFILAAWCVRQWGRERLAESAEAAISVAALFGTAFSIYLTFLELAVIRAACLWCLMSAVVIMLILLFNSDHLRRAVRTIRSVAGRPGPVGERARLGRKRGR